MSEDEIKMLDRLGSYVLEHGVSNDFLVQLIEQAGGFLNLKTLPDYAKANNISYNGAKKHRDNVTIFNTKFIIDNN